MKILIKALTLMAMITGSSWAVYINTSSASSLQNVIDGLTVAPVPGVSNVDVNSDQLEFDEYWQLTATGGSVNTLIVELAGFAAGNIFGIYDRSDITKMVEVFPGAATASDQATISIMANGDVKVNSVVKSNFGSNVFGYYLHVDATGATYYSDISLNPDSFDHFVAFQGNNIDQIQIPGYFAGLWTDNEFIVAFEDLDESVSDFDFSDMVVMVESVIPVPEPATVGLLGLGLIAMAFAVRRKKSA